MALQYHYFEIFIFVVYVSYGIAHRYVFLAFLKIGFWMRCNHLQVWSIRHLWVHPYCSMRWRSDFYSGGEFVIYWGVFRWEPNS